MIPPIKRSDNGHRRYQVTDLGWVDYVLCLKAVGMLLEDIKRYVVLQSEDDQATLTERIQLLETHRGVIRHQIDELEANLTMIENKIVRYQKKFV